MQQLGGGFVGRVSHFSHLHLLTCAAAAHSIACPVAHWVWCPPGFAPVGSGMLCFGCTAGCTRVFLTHRKNSLSRVCESVYACQRFSWCFWLMLSIGRSVFLMLGCLSEICANRGKAGGCVLEGGVCPGYRGAPVLVSVRPLGSWMAC
jgi:hypothetical protein